MPKTIVRSVVYIITIFGVFFYIHECFAITKVIPGNTEFEAGINRQILDAYSEDATIDIPPVGAPPDYDGPVQAVPLMDCLSSEYPSVRQTAAQKLGEVGTDPAILENAALNDPDYDVREKASLAIWNIRYRQASPANVENAILLPAINIYTTLTNIYRNVNFDPGQQVPFTPRPEDNGNWVANGAYQQTAVDTDAKMTLLNDLTLNDGTISVSVKCDLYAGAYVCFRMADITKDYECGYAALVYPQIDNSVPQQDSAGLFELYKISNGVMVKLGSALVKPFNINDYHTVNISLSGVIITARLGGQTLTANDDTYPSGKVGLMTDRSTSVAFDNFYIANGSVTFRDYSDPTKTPEVIAWAMEHLGDMGSSAAIPLLVKIIYDKETTPFSDYLKDIANENLEKINFINAASSRQDAIDTGFRHNDLCIQKWALKALLAQGLTDEQLRDRLTLEIEYAQQANDNDFIPCLDDAIKEVQERIDNPPIQIVYPAAANPGERIIVKTPSVDVFGYSFGKAFYETFELTNLGTPENPAANLYTKTVMGRDGYEVSQSITIYHANATPSITVLDSATSTAIGDQPVIVEAGQPVALTVSGTDADDEELLYFAFDLPGDAIFDDATNTFNWTPSNVDVGEYDVTFEVDDGNGMRAQKTVNITVIAEGANPPTGSIVINNQDAVTTSPSVTLTLSASSSAGTAISEMKFSNDNINWSMPEAFAATKVWMLEPVNGDKTVYVRFKDAAGNWSLIYLAHITFASPDQIPPTGSIVINDGALIATSASVILTLSAADDTGGSGLSQMQLSNDNIKWLPPETYAATRAWLLTQGDGMKTVYAKFQDFAGNWSIIYNATIALNIDTTAPSGTVVINGGAAVARSTGVTLTLSVADNAGGSGLSQMQFSNDNETWSPAEAFAATKAWTLEPVNGDKTVYVRFKNTAGNWSGTYKDTITLNIDITAPTGTVVINGGAANATSTHATLTLSAIDDIGGSGMGAGAQMQLSNDNINWLPPEPYGITKGGWVLIPGNGFKTVYVKFADAAGNWSQVYSDSIALAIPDTTPPTGYISINVGTYTTNSTGVMLTLSANDNIDGSGMDAGAGAQMQFSNDNITWSPPESYATTRGWTLASGNGIKTVYARFKDCAGNWSSVNSDTINLDTTAPTGWVVINGFSPITTSTNVTLALCATDNTGGSGVSEMQFRNETGNWSPSQTYATTTAWTLTSGSGIKTVYVKFKDVAGNWSMTYYSTIILDISAPMGSVKINGDAATTTSTGVMLTLSATDNVGGSGMGPSAQMKVSNATGDDAYWSTVTAEPYATTRGWVLTPGNGVKVVFVRLKDAAGNWSVPFADSIILAIPDTIPPMGSIVINYGAAVTTSTGVTLTLQATDNLGGSGMGPGAQMKLSNATGDNAYWSTVTAEPYATNRVWTFTPVNGIKYVYVKFKDVAGNWSPVCSGSITLAVPDTTPPTGSVLINNGAPLTISTGVMLTLSATDNPGGSGMEASAGAQMKVSNSTGDNTYWSTVIAEPYATNRNWTLTPGNGTKYVYVKFKDVAGNWSVPYAGYITLAVPDTTPPTGSISINYMGTSVVTNSKYVTLLLSASDNPGGSGLSQMQFSNDNMNNWLPPEPYATFKSWTLTSGDGSKNVYVRFKDYAGNWSMPYSSMIYLDTTAPTGSVQINYGVAATNSRNVTLTFLATDSMGGLGLSQMQFSNDNITWSTPENYPSPGAPTKTWILSSGDGAKTVYARFKDYAGNWSIAYSSTILLDTTAPTGNVAINGGVATTTSTNVTLAPSAVADNPGGSGMELGKHKNIKGQVFTFDKNLK